MKKKSSVLTIVVAIFFALVSIIYVMPIVEVLINSFKLNTFVNTETFALPNSESYA